MAAPRDREQLKAFIARRKPEYSLRFPFLTERQILAKIRRVWETQKTSATPRSGRQENGIQLPYATSREPTTTSCKGRSSKQGYGKSCLSAFDVDSDSVVPFETTHTRRRYTKCCAQASKLPTKHTATNPPSTNNRVDATAKTKSVLDPWSPVNESSRAASSTPTCAASSMPTCAASNTPTCTASSTPTCTASSTQTCAASSTPTQPSPPALLVSKPQRHRVLNRLENILTPENPPGSLTTTPSTQDSVTESKVFTPHIEVCAGHRKEAVACQSSTTNTVSFRSSEARHVPRRSMRTRKTTTPIRAEQMIGYNLVSEQMAREETAAVTHKPSPPTHCPIQQSPEQDSHMPCDTGRIPLDETFLLREYPEVVSLSLNPASQPLPSPRSATPNVDKFLQDGVQARSSSLIISADEISVFDTVSNGVIEAPVPSYESKPLPHDSHVPIVPSGDCDALLCDNQIDSSFSSRTPALGKCIVRQQFQRHRPRRRKSSHWHSRRFTHLSDSMLLGANEGGTPVNVNVSPVAKGGRKSVRQGSVEFEEETRYNPVKKQKMSGMSSECSENSPEYRDDAIISSCDSYDSVGASNGKIEEGRQALPQIVPEDAMPLTQNGSFAYFCETSSAKPTNLMCDMFQRLSPDGPRPETSCHQHCCEEDTGSYSSAPIRRVFKSADKEGDSNFYSMFVNESDIFM